MPIQHKSLQKRWAGFPFHEQMTNVGSEVGRTISGRKKGNLEDSKMAFVRALELLSFTKNAWRGTPRAKELSQVYEQLVDYFAGENKFKTSDEFWHRYFDKFAQITARRRYGV